MIAAVTALLESPFIWFLIISAVLMIAVDLYYHFHKSDR